MEIELKSLVDNVETNLITISTANSNKSQSQTLISIQNNMIQPSQNGNAKKFEEQQTLAKQKQHRVETLIVILLIIITISIWYITIMIWHKYDHHMVTSTTFGRELESVHEADVAVQQLTLMHLIHITA